MNKNSKAILIIVVIILALFGAYKYHAYKIEQSQKAKMDLYEEMSLLSKIIINTHDCTSVIEKAKVYLSNKGDVPEIWNIIGACQFDMGQLGEAKISFQKVLSLDSGSESAKKYLERLNIPEGAIEIYSSESEVTQDQFEKELGVKLEGILTFKSAVKKPSNIAGYFLATYISSKNFNDTVTSLSGVLIKANLKVSVSKTTNSTIMTTTSDSEQRIFSVMKGSPVTLKIEYFKLK